MDGLSEVAVQKSWFEARMVIFAWLGFLTFMFLMFLLVFVGVMGTCCWLRRECDREKRVAAEARFGEVNIVSDGMVWTEKEKVASSEWNPGKKK